MRIGDEIYEFVPISDPRTILLEKKIIKPFHDPLMLLHSALSEDEKMAWRDSVIHEVECGIKDLIHSLYFDYSPAFIVRASIRLVRAQLLLANVVPRPTHMFHQLRRHIPRTLYKLRELWGLDTAPMERLDPLDLKSELQEVQYELAYRKLKRLAEVHEHLSAKILLLDLMTRIPVKGDRDPFSKVRFLPAQNSPRDWIWWIREKFKEILERLKS